MKLLAALLVSIAITVNGQSAKALDKYLSQAAKFFTATDDGFAINIPAIFQAEVNTKTGDFTSELNLPNDSVFKVNGANSAPTSGLTADYALEVDVDAAVTSYPVAVAIYPVFKNYQRVDANMAISFKINADYSAAIILDLNENLDDIEITSHTQIDMTMTGGTVVSLNVHTVGDGTISDNAPDAVKISWLKHFPYTFDVAVGLEVNTVCTQPSAFILQDDCAIVITKSGKVNDKDVGALASYQFANNVASIDVKFNTNINENHQVQVACRDANNALSTINCGEFYHISYTSPENDRVNVLTVPGCKTWEDSIYPELKKKAEPFIAVYETIVSDKPCCEQEKKHMKVLFRLSVLIVHFDSYLNNLKDEFDMSSVVQKSRLNSVQIMRWVNDDPALVQASKKYLGIRNLKQFKRMGGFLNRVSKVANRKIINLLKEQKKHVVSARQNLHRVSGPNGATIFKNIYG